MNRQSYSGIVFCFFCCLFLSACNTEQIAESFPPSDPMICSSERPEQVINPLSSCSASDYRFAPELKAVTKQQQYQLLLTLPSGGAPLNQPFDLLVDVLNPVGQPVDYPVDLELDAGMRAHNHGMNTLPEIRALSHGQFRVEQMLFHMPGEWNLAVKVKRGVMGDSADINLEVCP